MRAMFSLRQPVVTAAAALSACFPGPSCAEDSPADIAREAEPAGSERREPATTPAATADLQSNGALRLDDVVVTGNAARLSKMRSSVSISTFDADQIRRAGPDSASDILRSVPGVLAQSSGGEGNANVTARGLPLSGGAKLMLFQEDGLPVLGFGDIDFATADTFVRADYSLDRVDVIRGGSAATFASNAPGGIFNFISKTGEVEGGNIGLTRGLDFDRTRLDFDYGRPLDKDWRFHVGGFYRYGEGPRTVGYAAENGGQLKGNVTRNFDAGYVRASIKILHDRAPVYLPVPVSITGTASDPQIASLPGFDVLHGAMQSKYFRQDLSVNRNGEVVGTDIADGYYSKSEALGLEAAFDLAKGWKFDGKLRVAAISGRFVGPYPAAVDTASSLAEAIGGAGSTLRYATGPQAGQAIANPAALNGNGLAVQTHLFNTTLNDMGNFAQDFKFTKEFKGNDQSASLVLGYFKSMQKIDQDWHWNTYLLEVKGQDAALLDVVDAQGRVVTQRGLVAYGEPLWGNCCVRAYRLRYDTDAPYVALNWQKGPFNVDASLRYDIARGSGSYSGASGTTAVDVNRDGTLQPPEQTVPIVDERTRLPVDYTVRYLSYSLGGNYLVTPDLALFARVSDGGRANAERVLFGGGVRADGSIAKEVAVNTVQQVEGGIKWRTRGASLFATLFHATTKVTDQDITSTTTRFVSRVYDANGLELEGAFDSGPFSLRAGLTYTHGKISKDEITPQNVGQQINPRYMFQLTPAYQMNALGLGLNIIGTSPFPSVGAGSLANPGFVQVNAFASYALDRRLTLSLTGNNIFDRIGITEIPNAGAGITANGANTARSVNGRTVALSLNYSL
jgi:outer membrane receptor protein involved in Fe transport